MAWKTVLTCEGSGRTVMIVSFVCVLVCLVVCGGRLQGV